MGWKSGRGQQAVRPPQLGTKNGPTWLATVESPGKQGPGTRPTTPETGLSLQVREWNRFRNLLTEESESVVPGLGFLDLFFSGGGGEDTTGRQLPASYHLP